jgi:hypothetical protein
MNVLELMGLSLIVAAVSGMTMGLYLAAVNHYIPTRSLRKSTITNVVVTVSFFLPIALQRIVTDDPSLNSTAWFALGFLYLAFATAADVTNYIICHRRTP